jgi:hypothetical protein
MPKPIVVPQQGSPPSGIEDDKEMAAVAEMRARGGAGDRPSTIGMDAVGPYLEETIGMLMTVDTQAVNLALSVDGLLGTLSGKMGDISETSKEYSRSYDNLVSGAEQSIDLAVRLTPRRLVATSRPATPYCHSCGSGRALCCPRRPRKWGA